MKTCGNISSILKSNYIYLLFVFALIAVPALTSNSAGSPDLTISLIDVAGFSSDCQTLDVEGSVDVMVDNIGNAGTDYDFLVVVFEL